MAQRRKKYPKQPVVYPSIPDIESKPGHYLGIRILNNLFSLVAFREDLHRIERTATIALFDLNGCQRAAYKCPGAGGDIIILRSLLTYL
jgi:hypothetical protein